MRVLTLTLNPAIDQTVTLDRLEPGKVNRAGSAYQSVGGKGVNVASCLADWLGRDAVEAFGLLGTDNASPFEALFKAKGIADSFLRVAGATRVNLKLVDASDTTDINLTGLAASAAHVAEACRAMVAQASADTLVVLAGSLPPGCPPDIYASLTSALRARGARVLLDTSGEPLARALASDSLPSLIKPNRHELADWCGSPLDTTAAVVREAQGLRARGVEWVVVSMGAEGALFVAGEGVATARLALRSVHSTVGAGDAMVAGLAAALVEGADLERTARLATAFAVAKLAKAGPNLPERDTVEALARAVTITR